MKYLPLLCLAAMPVFYLPLMPLQEILNKTKMQRLFEPQKIYREASSLSELDDDEIALRILRLPLPSQKIIDWKRR